MVLGFSQLTCCDRWARKDLSHTYTCIHFFITKKSVDLSISPFCSVSFCFLHFEDLGEGFRITVSFRWIDPSVIMKHLTISLVILFLLKPTLSDIITDNPNFSRLVFSWYFLPIFLLYIFVVKEVSNSLLLRLTFLSFFWNLVLQYLLPI